MSLNSTQKSKGKFIQKGKTRIESLKSRIDIAFETIKNLYDEAKLEKISQQKKELKTKNANPKEIQYDLEQVANTIVNKEGAVNLKTVILPQKDQENEEQKEEEKEDILVVNPFIKKLKFIINELTNLQTNSKIDESELCKEVAQLPKRGIIELAISKNKLFRSKETLVKKDEDKNLYIKKLENEIITQRLSLEELKKTEGEHLLQISTLQDQIRILKSKVFGYDIAKKYEYYKEHEPSKGPSSHIQDENLAYSMWEKENYAERKAPTKLNKLENEKQMWIANSNSNINKLENDVKLANSYRFGKNLGINNDEDNGLWTKTPNEAKNKNGNYGFNNYSSGYKRADNQGMNELGNMRKITPMIMNNKKKY